MKVIHLHRFNHRVYRANAVLSIAVTGCYQLWKGTRDGSRYTAMAVGTAV